MVDYGIKRNPEAPVNYTQPTQVPGVGLLGPDLGGAVKGSLLRQEYMLNQNEDARKEEYLGINKEEIGIKKEYLKIAQDQLGIQMDRYYNFDRKDLQHQQDITNGMVQAAQEGGYSGVIDFLKVSDPAQALQFHAKKIELDNMLLNNDTLKATSANEKNKALMESYGVIGKVGQAILNAPPEQREKMWNAMGPIRQQIFGSNGPKTMEEAAPYFQLAVAQNTPENILYAGAKTSVANQTELGKYSQYEQELVKKGATKDNSQELRDVQTHLQALREKDVQEHLQTLKAEHDINVKKSAQDEHLVQQDTESFNKTLNQASKDYNTALDSFSQVKAHIEALKKDPNNSYSQSVMSRMFIKSVNSGAMGLADEALQDGVTGIAGLNKKLQNLVGPNGFKVHLTPVEQKALAQAWETSMKGKYDRQKALEEQFLTSSQEYANVNKKALRMPSAQYEKINQLYKDNEVLNQFGYSNVPYQYKGQLAGALRKAKNNPKLQEYIKSQYQKRVQGQ